MKLFPKFGLLLLILLPAAPARAELKLAALFGDNMVLQQQAETPIWGRAPAGRQVTISIGETAVETTADADGKWMAKLPPRDAGYDPLEISVRTGEEQAIVIRNVLVGEVWLCSGQSNMQWTISQSMNPQEEIAAGDFPAIRMFTVARVDSVKPVDDVRGQWQVASPQTLAHFSAVAYAFGRNLHQELDIPVGLINSSWGGTLAEAWTSREALESNEDFAPILPRGQGRNRAAVLYNGMLAPLMPYRIRGAIWYQGESNVSRARQYATLFPTMIADWRQRWGQGDFPFYFVQLAPYNYGGGGAKLLPELWEAQLSALKSVPRTGMAVTTDISDLRDIHPKNKQEVGRRLALWALAHDYGREDIVYSGPIYESASFAEGRARIKFSHVAEGLASSNGQPLTFFEIAGEDQRFVPATAEIDGGELIVSGEDVPQPVAVRFGWIESAEPNLVNSAGLPASPFRTDDWPGLTDDNK